jgi:hydratase-aldolase
MLRALDLRGLMALMPAFATANAADVDATDTVDVDNLRAGVDRIIRDGADIIATTGSFGEFHTLLSEEFATLTHATVEAVNYRVPLFIGATGLNTRQVLRKLAIVRDAGADGVLLGVPFYFPSTVENAVRFYQEVAERFPTLAIVVYHNPALHHVLIPVAAFRQLAEIPNVIGVKDTLRDTRSFLGLRQAVRERIAIFCFAGHYFPFGELGAAGFWTYECWMGPWPLLRLRDAVAQGDRAAALEITSEVTNLIEGPQNQQWRETAAKLAVGYAGYCQPGPLRPPFLQIPPDVDARARARAERWTELCAKYRTPAASQ